MTVIYQDGYTLPDGGYLLKEDGFKLLLEQGGAILLDAPYDLEHARILHSEKWLAGGTATASSTATGYDADAPANSLTYEYWEPASTTATWEYTHTVSAECNCAGIAAHTLGTTGTNLKFEYYDGTAWADLTSYKQITSNQSIMAFWEDVKATRFRVSLSYAGAAPQIGVIKFGTQLTMPQKIFGGHAPLDLSGQTILRSNYSETGQFLGRAKQRAYQATQFAWTHLRDDWVRENWPSLQRGVESEPFFIAWRPGQFDTVGFAQTDQVPIPSNMGVKDYMQVTLDVRSLGYE